MQRNLHKVDSLQIHFFEYLLNWLVGSVVGWVFYCHHII